MDLKRPTIYVIDGDEATRNGLRVMLNTLDVNVKIFSSAEEFLSTSSEREHVCLIADVNLPGINGVELLEYLNQSKLTIPTILLDSNGDVHMAVRAMRAGVIDFIEKPFVGRLLVKRVCDVLGVSS